MLASLYRSISAMEIQSDSARSLSSDALSLASASAASANAGAMSVDESQSDVEVGACAHGQSTRQRTHRGGVKLVEQAQTMLCNVVAALRKIPRQTLKDLLRCMGVDSMKRWGTSWAMVVAGALVKVSPAQVRNTLRRARESSGRLLMRA